MSWTKKQLIEEAFGELALAGYVFDLTPEEMQSALRRLDSMMATWSGKGINLSYPLPSEPDSSDIDADSNVPGYATEAVYLNLAIRIAAGYGKSLMPSTLINAKNAYDVVLSRAAMPPEVQFKPLLPAGAGNKAWRTTTREPFLPEPDESIKFS